MAPGDGAARPGASQGRIAPSIATQRAQLRTAGAALSRCLSCASWSAARMRRARREPVRSPSRQLPASSLRFVPFRPGDFTISLPELCRELVKFRRRNDLAPTGTGQLRVSAAQSATGSLIPTGSHRFPVPVPRPVPGSPLFRGGTGSARVWGTVPLAGHLSGHGAIAELVAVGEPSGLG